MLSGIFARQREIKEGRLVLQKHLLTLLQKGSSRNTV